MSIWSLAYLGVEGIIDNSSSFNFIGGISPIQDLLPPLKSSIPLFYSCFKDIK
jgi:hypothetical protein